MQSLDRDVQDVLGDERESLLTWGNIELGMKGGDACAGHRRLYRVVVVPPVSRNRAHQVPPVRPGPEPVFTERTVVRLRPDQVRQLDRVATAFLMTRSDVLRLAVDLFGRAIEDGPWLARLEDLEVEP